MLLSRFSDFLAGIRNRQYSGKWKIQEEQVTSALIFESAILFRNHRPFQENSCSYICLESRTHSFTPNTNLKLDLTSTEISAPPTANPVLILSRSRLEVTRVGDQ